MSFAVGILILIAGVLVSIGLHEIGHMLPAKKFGVKVPEYSIGFGPTIYKWRRGETTYFLKAIPLGGYVRMAGMFPPPKAEPARGADGRLTWAEEARAEARADIGPGEGHRAFSALPAWKKLIIMFGGPITNWLLAGAIIAIVFVGIGVPALTAKISNVPPCLNGEQCTNPDSPAFLAGLAPGDIVTSWDGDPIDDWDSLAEAIRAGGTDPVTVEIMRGGNELSLMVEPVETVRVITDADGTETEEAAPFVGVSPSLELQPRSIAEVPGTLMEATGATAGVLLSLPTQLWSAVQSMVGDEPAEDRSVVSIVGVGHMAGSIASAPSEDYTLQMRAVDMLMLIASLNLALFIFNMIPLLPLDGGHIVGALWEGARRTVAKAAGRPDPGPVDLAPLMKAAYWVLGGLLLMTVILVWADIANPIAG